MAFNNYLLLFFLSFLLYSCSPKRTEIQIVATTDVHGKIFTYDYANQKEEKSSLSKVFYLIDSLKNKKKSVLIFDSGDLLQGTPAIYHQNYLQEDKYHPIVPIMKYIGYHATVVGNHDIECGPEIYNALKEQFNHPWLGANITNKTSKTPHFKPYTILNKEGVKIAVLGLITPGIPKWLPENLWENLEFEDMVESAYKWIDTLKTKEKPDFIIGLFHSGWDSKYGGVDSLSHKNENASLTVAHQVDGFDLIFIGHDHDQQIFEITNKNNKRVVVVDCGSHAKTVGRARLKIEKNHLTIDSVWVENIERLNNSTKYDSTFAHEELKIKAWIQSPICTINKPINCQDALTEPSAYMNLIHEVQLESTNADISLATPLTIYHSTSGDTLRESDLFKLYPFENKLYTINMSGKEILAYLEYSALLWFNETFPKSTLLRYNPHSNQKKLENPFFNFASAGGLSYKIDLRRKPGERIYDVILASGQHLLPLKKYIVAINSYQANGGGGHLIDGAGIPKHELKKRVISITDEEIRTLLRNYLIKQKQYTINKTFNWQVEPMKEWKNGAHKEKKAFFGIN